MKKAHVVIKCTPSGDVYDQGTALHNNQFDKGAIHYTIRRLLDRAMAEHGLFESYKVEVNFVEGWVPGTKRFRSAVKASGTAVGEGEHE